MRLALEMPIPDLAKAEAVTDFSFLLSHLFKHPKYVSFFAGIDKYKILDNSTNELHAPASVQTLVEQARLVRANAIVLPDYEDDAERTLEAVRLALKYPVPKDLERIGVIQGATETECASLAREYLGLGITYVAVPCDTAGARETSLREMARRRASLILHLPGKLKIHLLAVSLPEELLNYRHDSRVTSVDTGAPVLNALHGRRFGVDDLMPKRVYIPYNKPIPENAWSLVWHNINTLRRYL